MLLAAISLSATAAPARLADVPRVADPRSKYENAESAQAEQTIGVSRARGKIREAAADQTRGRLLIRTDVGFSSGGVDSAYRRRCRPGRAIRERRWGAAIRTCAAATPWRRAFCPAEARGDLVPREAPYSARGAPRPALARGAIRRSFVSLRRVIQVRLDRGRRASQPARDLRGRESLVVAIVTRQRSRTSALLHTIDGRHRRRRYRAQPRVTSGAQRCHSACRPRPWLSLRSGRARADVLSGDTQLP